MTVVRILTDHIDTATADLIRRAINEGLPVELHVGQEARQAAATDAASECRCPTGACWGCRQLAETGTRHRPHGTEAAHRAHIRAGETPCDDCRLAYNTAQRRYYQQRTTS